MRKLKFIATLIILASMQTFSQTNWTIDRSHSHILFSIKHMIISNVTGYFRIFDGKIVSNSDDFNNTKVDFEIDAKSINTENEKRDNHLRGTDFFDTEKFPKITFKSKSFKKISGSDYEIVGDLTMKGVTKQVKFTGDYNGSVKDPMGNTRAGFSLSTKINRFDYGLNWNKTIESGSLVASNEVKITVEIEIFRK